MKKSQTTRRQAQNEDDPAADDRRTLARKIRQLQTIRAQYANRVIAAGIFGADELWTEIASQLGQPAARKYEDALAKVLGDTRIPDPDDRTKEVAASDLVCSAYIPYLDAGFLLGVAVGMQLGPSAFANVAEGGSK